MANKKDPFEVGKVLMLEGYQNAPKGVFVESISHGGSQTTLWFASLGEDLWIDNRGRTVPAKKMIYPRKIIIRPKDAPESIPERSLEEEKLKKKVK